jgi:glycosyltransferase involved in cell wall biosynthesis
MRDADLVFTIANSMRGDLVGRGVDRDHVVVIPNAVDATAFVPRPPDQELCRSLGLHDRFVLGYISNLGWREGLDVLIDGVARLVRTRPHVACLIVGDGPEMRALQDQVRRLGLSESVRLTGAVPHEQIQRYYSLIDLFVIPRRDDEAARWVTPLKPFEAMAMARPLLVADLPALREVVAPGERGVTFRPGDPADLAGVAATLIDDRERLGRLGSAGRAWVERERTWAANGQRYREAYGRLGVQPAARS